VSAVGYRNPALLAKMAATLDIISGGRAILGIGGGWYEDEYNAYGYDFPRVGVRLGQLRDAVQLVKAMWADDRATYEGKHFVARDAILEPKPIQRPRPRILVGGIGERVTLRIAAEHAEMCNLMAAPPDVFQHKVGVLQSHLDRTGRTIADIEVTKLERLCLAATPEAAQSKWDALGGRSPQGYRSLIGTPDEAVASLKEFEALGCDAVFLSAANGDAESLDLFAREVMPAFA
ncbi:MAG: LLM class flavin-dependent oxidoreductase, partial [Chloroflexota bacterium]|nr:LLM class flavin-dependent oxidoreductase [Chloroflexota bacterium]